MSSQKISVDNIIVGMSGASGAVYGIRMLEILKECGVETHLVMTRNARLTVQAETNYSVADVERLASHVHMPNNLAASISSGSNRNLGMVVAPCSMRSLGEIATATSGNLLTRAADVCLKERRRLVLMVRETPLNLAHLRNMAAVTEMGGIIAPPVPAFYHRPDSIAAMVDDSVARVLALFGIDAPRGRRWEGMP